MDGMHWFDKIERWLHAGLIYSVVESRLPEWDMYIILAMATLSKDQWDDSISTIALGESSPLDQGCRFACTSLV